MKLKGVSMEQCYLTNIPQDGESWGLCKTLLCRRESIHIKHLLTEIFVRKSIDISDKLDYMNISFFDYIEFLTNRLRAIYKFDRKYSWGVNEIVDYNKQRFFPSIESTSQLKTKIILDFDGVITKKCFKDLYLLCVQRCDTIICSANPTITEDWFVKRGYTLPKNIYPNKGKLKKIKKLFDLAKRNDFLYYVDDETEYLEYAYIFGITTYLYRDKCIKYFTLQK